MSARMTYFVDEGGEWKSYPTLQEARKSAQSQIDYCLENCDPEWPYEVNDIAVYLAPSNSEYPSEDGKCVLKSTEIKIPFSEIDEYQAELMKKQGFTHVSEYELKSPIL